MTLRVAALVNWGVGQEVLRVLQGMPDVKLAFAVSGSTLDSPDVWARGIAGLALQNQIPLFPEGAYNPGWLKRLIRDEQIDLLVCHAFMRILPSHVLALPRLGALNLHGSLLPKLRGPSPHVWALKNGEAKSGITYHLMNEEVDCGPIVLQAACEISPSDGASELLDKLRALVAPTLPEALRRLKDPMFSPTPQDHSQATYAPRIT